MMKALCFALVAALCFGMAFSLKCYGCSTTGDNCMTETPCVAPADKFCQTEGTTDAGTRTVTKSCVAACGTPAGTATYFKCCNTDLCNKEGVSGSGGVRVSFSGLSLALGLSAMLVRAVL